MATLSLPRGPWRYRTLLPEQGVEVERALWVALRGGTHAAAVVAGTGRTDARPSDFGWIYRDRAHELRTAIGTLSELLLHETRADGESIAESRLQTAD
jgi:hypothetical protein